jgi:hypothetical protein
MNPKRQKNFPASQDQQNTSNSNSNSNNFIIAQPNNSSSAPKKPQNYFADLKLAVGATALVFSVYLGYTYMRTNPIIAKAREEEQGAGMVYPETNLIPFSLLSWVNTLSDFQIPFVLLSQYISLAFQQPPKGDTCLTTSPFKMYSVDQPQTLLDCFNPECVDAMKKRYPIDLKDNGIFNNTVWHYLAVNSDYRAFSKMYRSLTHEEKKIVATAIDINGRTPLHLSISVVAPGRFLRALMTPENVVMADEYGVTPLMLANAGFMNEVSTRHLVHLIGPKRLAQALAAKDFKGRTASEYGQLSDQEIREYLEDFVVDPDKAMNACFNAFESEKRKICVTSEKTRDLLTQYYDLGITHQCAKPVECVRTTKANLKTFIQMNNSPSKPYQEMKQSLIKNIEKKYPPFSSTIWDNDYMKDADGLLGHLSEQSLLDAIKESRIKNQKEVKAMVKEHKINLKK